MEFSEVETVFDVVYIFIIVMDSVFLLIILAQKFGVKGMWKEAEEGETLGKACALTRTEP